MCSTGYISVFRFTPSRPELLGKNKTLCGSGFGFQKNGWRYIKGKSSRDYVYDSTTLGEKIWKGWKPRFWIVFLYRANLSENRKYSSYFAVGEQFYQLRGCFIQKLRISHSSQFICWAQSFAISRRALTSSTDIALTPFLVSIYIIQ